jgi:uncharacterized protein (DUF1684 family)
MKFNKWYLIIALGLGGLIYVSIPEKRILVPIQDVDSLQVLKDRTQKDIEFAEAENSPIKDKAAFKHLSYFPYSKKYRIEFKVERAAEIKKVSMKMNDGTEEENILFGKIKGEIDGQAIELTLYQHENGDFFLPFKDKTAPTETYGGGRYLDFPLTKLSDNQILIDFNQAYFPYCAYNATFTCPIPPKENEIPFRIPAGEKNP